MKYFMTRIKQTNGEYTKGCEIHETLDSARQAFHAYLGAYGYGHETGTDYVAVYIVDMNGNYLDACIDNRIENQEGNEE